MKFSKNLWVGALWQAAMPVDTNESDKVTESSATVANNAPSEELQHSPA